MSNKKITLIAVSIFGGAVLIVALYMWLNKFAIDETAGIGDGFNGLLAPFISFAGALLVYLSFREQIKANKLITSQWNLDLYLRIIDEIKIDFENLEVKVFGIVIGDNRGRGALTALSEFPPKQVHTKSAYFDLSNIFAEMIFLMGKLKSEPLERQEFISRKLQQFYERNIKHKLPALIKILSANNENDTIAQLIGRANKIQNEIYDFRKKPDV